MLSEHIGNRHNSLDLLRLLAASAVIFGHSYAITNKGRDPIEAWNGVIFSGGVALHIFFFLSGILVTYSILKKPDIVHWFASRILRILPGLFVCLVLTTFVMGAWKTTLPLGRYLTNHDTWLYFRDNLLMNHETQYYLPGVFGNHLDKAINGPLWSLWLEVRLYLWAGLFFWIFQRARREWLTVGILAMVIVAFQAPAWLWVLAEPGNYIICSGLFATGALCAIWSDRVVISKVWLLVLFVAANHYVKTIAFTPLFFFVTCAFVLCFGYSRWLSRIRLPGDYSYGMYIYGWPVQQLVIDSFPQCSPLQLSAMALVGTACVSALSWHLVEKRSLAFKRKIDTARLLSPFAEGIAQYRLMPAAVRYRRTATALLACGAAMAAGLLFVRARKAEKVGAVVAYGPDKVTAGERFNVQPNGQSAVWLKLSKDAPTHSFIVFRGQKLDSSVMGPVVTAIVPDELFQQPGAAEMYVLNEGVVRERNAAVKVTIGEKASGR